MTPETCAQIHKHAFKGQSRAWNTAEFQQLLASPHVVLAHRSNAFALGRVIMDEAELLTIATAPEHQGQGLARTCLQHLEQTAHHRGATRLFLEVSADNTRARRLYQQAGYVETGRRVGYYASETGPVDAVLMHKLLN